MKKDSVKKDPATAIQVKKILEAIKKAAPGNAVELRIPSYGAIQCVAGVNHRRGTPANQVEMSDDSLIKLFNDPDLWGQMFECGEISASGSLSDLSSIFKSIRNV